MQFQVIRNTHGNLIAETRIDLGADHRQLWITTEKSARGGIGCAASVMQVSEDGRSFTHSFALSRFGKGDFRKTVAHDTTKRATVKALETMHAAALLTVETLLAEARAFYAAQATALEA